MVNRILRHAGLKPSPEVDSVTDETPANQLTLRFKS
jgi:hypothetical protein